MAANDKPSTSSSPRPGPSSSASGDQPNGERRERGKRKRGKTDRPENTKRSRVTSDNEATKDCCRCNMTRLVAHGQYQEALAYTRAKNVSIKAKLQRFLQKTMIDLITDERISCEVLGLDYADVMMYLLSERLQDYNSDDEAIFSEFFCAFLKPEYTGSLFKFVNKHTTNQNNKRMMWRIMLHGVEQIILGLLHLINMQADKPDYLQKCQKMLAHFVPMLPAILLDDSDPAMSLSWLHDNSTTSTIGDYDPLFAKAVELQLVHEAKLLYDAGAVNNAELKAVANKPGVQKMLKDEEDHSEMAVFLRKVLKKPQRLESLALLQVSRLMGLDVLGREDRVRQLPLASKLRDTLLLRPQLNRYRKEIECNEQGKDGGVNVGCQTE